MKVKCIFFEGRTPAKIIVSWGKKKKNKKGSRTGVIAVSHVCPYCCHFQTNEGKSPGHARVGSSGSRARPAGSHLGGHAHGLCFEGNLWPRDPCSVGGPGAAGLSWGHGLGVLNSSQHSTVQVGQGAPRGICSQSTFQREQWSIPSGLCHSAAAGLHCNSWLHCSFTLPCPASSKGFFSRPGEVGIPYPQRPAFPVVPCGAMQGWQVASPGPCSLPGPSGAGVAGVREKTPPCPVRGVMLAQQPYAGLPETAPIFKGVGNPK